MSTFQQRIAEINRQSADRDQQLRNVNREAVRSQFLFTFGNLADQDWIDSIRYNHSAVSAVIQFDGDDYLIAFDVDRWRIQRLGGDGQDAIIYTTADSEENVNRLALALSMLIGHDNAVTFQFDMRVTTTAVMIILMLALLASVIVRMAP